MLIRTDLKSIYVNKKYSGLRNVKFTISYFWLKNNQRWKKAEICNPRIKDINQSKLI